MYIIAMQLDGCFVRVLVQLVSMRWLRLQDIEEKGNVDVRLSKWKHQKWAATDDAYRTVNHLRMGTWIYWRDVCENGNWQEQSCETRLNGSVEKAAAWRPVKREIKCLLRWQLQEGKQQSASARHDVLDQCRLGHLAANHTKFK